MYKSTSQLQVIKPSKYHDSLVIIVADLKNILILESEKMILVSTFKQDASIYELGLIGSANIIVTTNSFHKIQFYDLNNIPMLKQSNEKNVGDLY